MFNIEVTISDIASFGAFCEFDHNNTHYKGLIHISEIDDSFVRDITDFIKVGDKVNVKVLSLDEKKNQAKCSIKQA